MLTISRLFLASTAALTVAAGASSGAGSSSGDDVKLGTYRVVLQTPGGELPFGLELERKGSGLGGYLINGPERLQLCAVKITGSPLGITIPGDGDVPTADA